MKPPTIILHSRLMAGAAADSPLYKEVKRLLTETIQSGEWKPGTAIPSERQLSGRFHVAGRHIEKSPWTNWCRTHPDPAAGTRHLCGGAQPRPHDVSFFPHPARRWRQADARRGNPVIQSPRAPTRIEASRLGIATGDKVFRIQNVPVKGWRPIRSFFDRVTTFPGAVSGPHGGASGELRRPPSTIYHLYQSVFRYHRRAQVFGRAGLRAVRAPDRIGRHSWRCRVSKGADHARLLDKSAASR